MTIETLLDIKDFLPDGIALVQNGIMPAERMQSIHCGGKLYVDAARSWRAMVRAAFRDNVFLNLNYPINAYRSIVQQRKMFQARFEELKSAPSDDAICVEFEGKMWRLKPNEEFMEVPGQSSHGFGLAVRIGNAALPTVKAWLDKNAEQFGFEKEYNLLPLRFVYTRSRQAIPERVLEIEEEMPEPAFNAEQIAQASGCQWLKTPSDAWTCNGIFSSRPFRAGALAVVGQGEKLGISNKIIEIIFRQCAGFVCTQPEPLLKYGRPILVTKNLRETTQKLKAFCTSNAAVSSAAVDIENLQSELKFYRKANLEAVIFERKKNLSERLLKISVDDLRTAATQPWYREYLALLSIRIRDAALQFRAKKYCDELLQQHAQRSGDESEIVVLCLLQFMEPLQLPCAFNQHLWSKEMIADVQSAFLHRYTRLIRLDDDISTYYLARQSERRHGRRKMRIAFVITTRNKGDKMLPVYRAFREREDVEACLVLCPPPSKKHSERFWQYFHEQFPNDAIYDANALMDLRQLEPDYVFYQSPYEELRPYPGFTSNEVVQFAKICHVSYGASLAHIFVDRLIADLPNFYRNIYLFFCSAATVKEKFTAAYSENAAMGYQHFEFLGYPILSQELELDTSEHSAKRILWTPRWSYDARIGGSHFLEYKDKFVALHEKYGDKVELSMRPHINTFRDLQAKGLISEAEVAEYKKRLKQNNVELHSMQIELGDEFRDKDILLSDYSSILIVYFLTGRPIIYCEFPNAVMMPEYQEMLDCMYIARSWEDVERYLDDLIAGNDPLFERRQAAVEKIRAAHANAIDRIVGRIIDDFNAARED